MIFPRRPLHIVLLLFHPRRNVMFGMPFFVGDNPGRLRKLLRGHGEENDNASVWRVALVGNPPQWTVRVGLRDGHESAYATALLEDVPQWRLQSTLVPDDQTLVEGMLRYEAMLPLTRVWVADRNAVVRCVTTAEARILKTHWGYWFPCDGAVALDLSEVGEPAVSGRVSDVLAMLEPFRPHIVDTFEQTLVERLMTQVDFVAMLRDRAECCFLLRAALGTRSCLQGEAQSFDVRRHRSSALRGRGGRLWEGEVIATRSEAG